MSLAFEVLDTLEAGVFGVDTRGCWEFGRGRRGGIVCGKTRTPSMLLDEDDEEELLEESLEAGTSGTVAYSESGKLRRWQFVSR